MIADYGRAIDSLFSNSQKQPRQTISNQKSADASVRKSAIKNQQ
jgi:hypothetical protein